MRLKSGSLRPGVALYAAHNTFIQQFFDPLTVDNSKTRWVAGDLGFLDISTDASGHISTWVVGACGSICDTQMQTNGNSPFSFNPGRDFSETTARSPGRKIANS